MRENKMRIAGMLDYGGTYLFAMKVFDPEYICPAITTAHEGIGQIKIEVEDGRSSIGMEEKRVREISTEGL